MGDIQLTDYKTREQWLARRHESIGASESAALFGVSPYDTALSLWARKTGAIAAIPSDNSFTKWGLRLEEPIARGYEEDSGRRLWRAPTPFAVAQHPRLPFLTSTPDFWVVEAPDRTDDGLVEVKNVSAFMQKRWDDGPPKHIVVQAQHQMACTGRSYVTVLPLFGGNDSRPIDVERNPAFIEELEAQAEWFWGYVQRKEQPPMIEERDFETLKRLHPHDDGTAIVLPDEAIALWEQLKEQRAIERDAKKANEALMTRFYTLIGKATFGLLPDGRTLSLKTSDRAGYTVQPTTFRSLREEKTRRTK